MSDARMPTGDDLDRVMYMRQPPEVTKAVQDKTLAIIGVGGLGSHVAYMAVKTGFSRLILCDPDTVSATNLSRQYYFLDQVGLPKVMALEYMLRFVMPSVEITGRQLAITKDNAPQELAGADLIIECVDDADTKAMLFEVARTRLGDVPWVFASGIGGYHSASEMHVRRVAPNVAVVGDEAHPDTEGVTMARVMQAAAMQLMTGIRMLMGLEP